MATMHGREVDGWIGHHSSDEAITILAASNLSLSSVDSDNTSESLIICVLQFVSGNYLASTLADVLRCAIPKETDRIQFHIKIEKLKSNHYGTLSDLVKKILQELKKISALENSTKSCNFTESKGLIKVTFPPINEQPKELILWRSNDAVSYRCITLKKWTYHSLDAYKNDLLEMLKNHFFNKIHLFSNEYFLRVSEDELTNLVEMSSEEFLMSRDYVTNAEKDLLDLTTDLESDDLKELIAQCLAEAWEESFQKRRQSNEDAIIREQQEQDQFQINIKKSKEQIEEKQKEVNSNQGTIDQLQDKLDQAKHQIEKAKSKLYSLNAQEKEALKKMEETVQKQREAMKKLEQQNEKQNQCIAWEFFLTSLQDVTPTYELVSLGPSHPLLKQDSASKLGRELCQHFKLDCNNYLHSYVDKNVQHCEQEMKRILKDLIQSPTVRDFGMNRQITGKAIVLSQMLKNFNLTFDEFHVHASKVIYIDCDLTLPGRNVSFSAPIINVLNSSKKINTSGQDAAQLPQRKAASGNRPGMSGDHGRHGEAGESGGHVKIECKELCGSLKIKANGGNGADGQDGGDGANGTDGNDGTDGHVTIPSNSWTEKFKSSGSLKKLSSGTCGKAGQSGGNGGKNGLGGSGGVRGSIMLEIGKGKSNCAIENSDGQQGKDGTPGKGGTGGKGGRNGIDRAIAHGGCWGADWKFGEGEIQFSETKNIFGWTLGYTLRVIRYHKGFALDGQHGDKGNKATEGERKNSKAKKQISNMNSTWADSMKKDSNSKLEQIEKDFKVQKSSLQRQAQKEHEQQKNHLNEIKRNNTSIKMAFKSANQNFSNIFEKIQLKKKKKTDAENEIRFQQSEIFANQKKSQESVSKQKKNEQSLQFLRNMANFKDKVCATFQVKTQERTERLGFLPVKDQLKQKVNGSIASTSVQPNFPKGSLATMDAIICREKDFSLAQKISILVQKLEVEVKDESYKSLAYDVIEANKTNSNQVLSLLFHLLENYSLVKQFNYSPQAEQQYLQCLQKLLKQKFGLHIPLKAAPLLHHLQVQTLEYSDLQALLNDLEETTIEELAVAIQLKLFYCKKIIGLISQKILKIEKDDVTADTITKQITEIFNFCLSCSKTPVQLSSFFNELVIELDKKPEALRPILDQFLLKKLNLKNPEDCVKKYVDEDTVTFLLSKMELGLEQLDKIWQEVKCLPEHKEIKNHLMEKFKMEHLNPWLCQISSKIQSRQEVILAFEDFKMAISWQHCKAPLLDRLKICQKAVEILKDDPTDQNFLSNQTENLIGVCDLHSKSLFEEIIKSDLEKSVKNSEKFISKILFLLTHRDFDWTRLEAILKLTKRKDFSPFKKSNLWMALKFELTEKLTNFIEGWLNQMLKQQAKSNETTTSSLKSILSNWQKECIDYEKNSVAEPSKEIKKMNILLEKVYFLSVKNMPIQDAVLFWKRLEDVKPKDLKSQLILQAQNQKYFQESILLPNESYAFKPLYNSPDSTQMVQIITELIKVLPNLKSTSIIESLKDFVMCQILWDDVQPIIETFPAWMDSFHSLKDIPEDISKAMLDLFCILQATAFYDGELPNLLRSRTKDLLEVQQSSFKVLHSMSSNSLQMVKLALKDNDFQEAVEKICKILDDSIKNLTITKISSMIASAKMKNLQVLTEILKKEDWSRKISTEKLENEEDLTDALFKIKESNEEIVVNIIHKLCQGLEIKNKQRIKPWVKQFQQFGEEFSDIVTDCCSILSGKCHQENLSRCDGDLDSEAQYFECLNKVKVITKFLSKSEFESNKLYLLGVISLSQINSTFETSKFVQNFLEYISDSVVLSKHQKEILDFYNSTQDPKFLAIIERCLQHQISQTEDSESIFEKLKSKLGNEVVPLVLTDEELFYAEAIGDKADEIISKEDIRLMKCSLKELAIQTIYEKTVLKFYPRANKSMPKLLKTWHFDKTQSEPGSANDELKCVLRFQYEFERAILFTKSDGNDFLWLYLFHEIIFVLLKNFDLPLSALTELLHYSTAMALDEFFEVVSSSRPYFWLNNLVIRTVLNTLKSFNQLNFQTCEIQLHQFLNKCKEGRAILSIFVKKIAEEEHTTTVWQEIVERLFQKLPDLTPCYNIRKFLELPTSQWHLVIRESVWSEQWSPALANQLNILDKAIGSKVCDKFLKNFLNKFGKNLDHLEKLLRNVSSYPLIEEQFKILSESNDESTWALIEDEEKIKKIILTKRNSILTPENLIDAILSHPTSQKWSKILNKKQLLLQIEEILNLRKDFNIKNLKNEEISWWVTNNCYDENHELKLVQFLAVASHIVFINKGFYPRDVQLLTILIYSVSSKFQQSCMAQISTGEGKTLIASLMAIRLALAQKSIIHQCVNIITSSPVLAEVNVKESKWLFDAFKVTVGNNCDLKCMYDEDVRRERYNNDVIYGDLASFQRDILLTIFFGKDVTKGRQPDAIVIDEVDSLLLDKGENVLYLSHRIPELDHLMVVFVEIWNCAHAPDAWLGSEKDVAQVLNHIQTRIKKNEIILPNCIRDFTNKHLLTWIRNAYKAKHIVTRNDSYKVEDLGDGKGQRLVIMDKETGVEQVQMTWSDGLHQFLQLKHTLKMSPISLKAIFMSNMSYFCQYPGKLFGMTGTLGSDAECQLLGEIFQVNFFVLPRFKWRLCQEAPPKLSKTKASWLANTAAESYQRFLKHQAVLIICENIEAVQEIKAEIFAFAEKELQSKNGELLKKLKESIQCYQSSFDKNFEPNLKDGAIVVATNLAGRGTDFQTDEIVEKNGGLHVIITYMPPNARVEAQAEGRTARAGKIGSYQFILYNSGIQDEVDPRVELQRLKIERDELESCRLEKIRVEGVERIRIEEEFLDRFYKEIYSAVKNKYDRKAVVPDLGLSNFVPMDKIKEVDSKLQLGFLTNHWAFWLNSVANDIKKVRLTGKNPILGAFEKFKSDMKSFTGSTGFATSPSDLMTLGKHMEKNDLSNIARVCYETVIANDPNFAEAAIISQVKMDLQKVDRPESKNKAKKKLKNVKQMILKKIDALLELNEIVKLTSSAGYKEGNAVMENLFEEQISNSINLFQVHVGAIDDILGRPLPDAINMQFTNEKEAKEILDLILSKESLYKGFRLSRKLVFKNDELFIQRQGTESKVDWLPMVDYCRADVLSLLKFKVESNKRFLPGEKLFSGMMISQNELWEKIVAEKIGDQKIIIDIEEIEILKITTSFDKFDNFKVEDLKLQHHQPALIEFFKSHKGEIFKPEKSLEDFQLSEESSKSLIELLKKEEILITDTIFQGKRNVSVDEKTEFPKSLEKYKDLLLAWVSKKDDEMLVKEDLQCHRSSEEASKEMWQCLVSQGVIKKPKINFIKYGTEDRIEDETKHIKENLKCLESDLGKISIKYHPQERVQEITTSDIWAFLKDNPLSAMKATINAITRPSDEDLEKILVNHHKEIIEYTTNQRIKDQKEAFFNQVLQSLLDSAGQLKKYPAVTASYRPIAEYFLSGKYLPEVEDFKEQQFDGVIILNSYKSLWDWKAFTIAMIGIAQIVIGVAVNVLSAGSLYYIGNSLIAEGAGDLIFAIQSGLSGTCTWEAYRSHKKVSLAITIVTAGIGAYVTWGNAAAKAAMYGSKAMTIWAIGKRVLIKCAQAIRSALVAMGVEKFLGYLKELILNTILEQVKDKIFGTLFKSSLKKMSQLMSKIFEEMKANNKTLSETTATISAAIEKTKSTLMSSWLNQQVIQASNVAKSMCNAFTESSAVIGKEGHLSAGNSSKAFANEGLHQGNNMINEGVNVILQAQKISEWTNKAMKFINVVKHGSEIGAIVAHAPELINKINDGLSHEKNHQYLQEKSGQQTKMTKEDKEEFEAYKQDKISSLQSEILDSMISSINQAWVQPFLQRRVEAITDKLGKKTVQLIGALFDDSDFNGSAEREHKKKNQDSKKKKKIYSDEIEEDQHQLNSEEVQTSKENYQKQFGNDLDVHLDHNNEVKATPKTYDEHIANVGQGQKCGLFDIQNMADMIGGPIEIVDETGKFPSNSTDGETSVFNPKGKSSNKAAIKLKFSTNADGSNHVDLIGPGGKLIPIDGSQNRCFLEAVAKAKGLPVDQLVSEYKNYLLESPRAKLLYQYGLNEQFPQLRVGHKSSKDNSSDSEKPYEPSKEEKPKSSYPPKTSTTAKQLEKLLNLYKEKHHQDLERPGSILACDENGNSFGRNQIKGLKTGLRLDHQKIFTLDDGSTKMINIQVQINHQGSRNNQPTTIAAVFLPTSYMIDPNKVSLGQMRTALRRSFESGNHVYLLPKNYAPKNDLSKGNKMNNKKSKK